MKFSTKLTLAVMVLLSLAIAASGFVLVRAGFNSTLDTAVEQNLGQHLMERYALESELLRLLARGEDAGGEQLARYGATLNRYMGDEKLVAFLSAEGRVIYQSPVFATWADEAVMREATAGGENMYSLRRSGNNTMMLTASLLDGPGQSLWLVNGYDLSGVFAQREGQLTTLLWVQLGVLALGAGVVWVQASLLTRPIRKLNRASRRIAEGAYSVRTGIQSADEIGQLSRNFDAMAVAVEAQVEQLNDSLQRRDDFVSAFTHEIKTPMTSIIGFSDLLRSMEVDERTRHRAANNIFYEAKRLERLSQQLLALMGLTGEDAALAAVPLKAVFTACYRSLLPLPGNILLEFSESEGIWVLANGDLAADLLRNLILNAMHAKPRDGRIRVLARVHENRCQVAVRDTGCGIPPEELAHITEPFYMVDKSRARAEGGSGIGLSLCQRIALLHGGPLHFQSQVGKGTQVSFSLGLAQTAPEA